MKYRYDCYGTWSLGDKRVGVGAKKYRGFLTQYATYASGLAIERAAGHYCPHLIKGRFHSSF